MANMSLGSRYDYLLCVWKLKVEMEKEERQQA